MRKWILSFSFIAFSFFSFAQEIEFTGEVRPRFENRNGYRFPRKTYQSADNFVSQRTRLTLGFKLGKIELGVALQDVRVWGEASIGSKTSKGLSFQKAWALYHINDKWSLKFGRQVLEYDDERIMGGADWAQEGRSHDALLVQWIPNSKNRIDFGLAYNNDNEAGFDTLYSNIAGYKTFQYGWYHRDFNKLSFSFLLLNTGIEYETVSSSLDYELKLDYNQTFGPYLSFTSGHIFADFSTYMQTGKEEGNTKLAYFVGGSFRYSWKSGLSLGAGGQFLSGKGQDNYSSENFSFNPIFGTNHKFNGWMDYFYVGNFKNSVGLIDINMTLGYTYKRISAQLIPHYFQADGNVLNNRGEQLNKYLGTELDAVVVYELDKNVDIKAGYSQMLATNSMTTLKGGTTVDNHWAWVMITVNPTIFKSNPKKTIKE